VYKRHYSRSIFCHLSHVSVNLLTWDYFIDLLRTGLSICTPVWDFWRATKSKLLLLLLWETLIQHQLCYNSHLVGLLGIDYHYFTRGIKISLLIECYKKRVLVPGSLRKKLLVHHILNFKKHWARCMYIYMHPWSEFP